MAEIFYRRNAGDAHNAPLQPMSESEVRPLLAVVRKDVNRAMAKLRKGETVRTRYATYSKNLIEP